MPRTILTFHKDNRLADIYKRCAVHFMPQKTGTDVVMSHPGKGGVYHIVSAKSVLDFDPNNESKRIAIYEELYRAIGEKIKELEPHANHSR